MSGLPFLLKQLEARWSLCLGEPFEHAGSCSWVAPVTRACGEPAVLKLAMPHMEGQDEISGLRFWNGQGAVELLEADLESGAMLLERCWPGTTLHSESETRQDEVVATLLKRIWSLTRSPSELSGSRLGRGEVGSAERFPLLHAPCWLKSATLPEPVVDSPAKSVV